MIGEPTPSKRQGKPNAVSANLVPLGLLSLAQGSASEKKRCGVGLPRYRWTEHGGWNHGEHKGFPLRRRAHRVERCWHRTAEKKKRRKGRRRVSSIIGPYAIMHQIVKCKISILMRLTTQRRQVRKAVNLPIFQSCEFTGDVNDCWSPHSVKTRNTPPFEAAHKCMLLRQK